MEDARGKHGVAGARNAMGGRRGFEGA